MADIRIKVAKDKAKLVKALRAGEGSTGPFQTYYELLAFAASLGVRKKRYVPFQERDASRDIDPIRQEQFASKGYDQLVNLIAITHSQSPKILEDKLESEKNKVEIFEAYCNGGLEIIEGALRGSGNDLQQILLLLISEGKKVKVIEEDVFDMSFLS
jgi:dnd system-associated protein 4